MTEDEDARVPATARFYDRHGNEVGPRVPVVVIFPADRSRRPTVEHPSAVVWDYAPARLERVAVVADKDASRIDDIGWTPLEISPGCILEISFSLWWTRR
jgi:hypothetical protein